jgi:hypothetical protein
MNIEIAKLLISVLTPISLIIIGYFVNRTLALQGKKWRENDKLVAKRIDIYSEIASPLNKIYCYIQDVGDYKSLDPEMIIKSKRTSDRLFHMFRPIWSRETIQAYKSFSAASFAIFSGSGEDAKIKTLSVEKKSAVSLRNKKWPDTWDELLTEKRDPDYHKKYVRLMNAFSKDLGYKASKD